MLATGSDVMQDRVGASREQRKTASAAQSGTVWESLRMPKRRTAKQRWSTAIHEAGHAVIGRVLSLRCGGASIVPDFDAGEAGHSILDDPWATVQDWEYQGKRHDRIDKALRARIIVLMAGAEAEELIIGKFTGGDGDDRYEITSLATSSDSGLTADKWTRFEPRMRRQCRRLVRRYAEPIKLVAKALIERDTLQAEEIDDLAFQVADDVRGR